MPVGVYCEYDDDKEIYKSWTSKSESWETMPAIIYLESKNVDTMAERIVSKIKSITPAPVFITRNLKREDYFYRVLSHHGFKAEGKSLIEMKPVPLKFFPVTDWIFFSSKNAVTFFFLQKPSLGNQKFGCIGKSTADAIRKFGKRAEFIGYSADTKMTGKQFASRVGSGMFRPRRKSPLSRRQYAQFRFCPVSQYPVNNVGSLVSICVFTKLIIAAAGSHRAGRRQIEAFGKQASTAGTPLAGRN